MKSIVKMKFGSHLYGTNTPASDFDYKGVYLPELRDILLGRVRETFNDQRKKVSGEKNEAGEEDTEFFSLKQYLKLVSEGQTVSLDMLFCPPEYVIENDLIWLYIQQNRHRLISKKSSAFVGYCLQQAKKYGIKGSRVAVFREALEFFKCGDPDAKIGTTSVAVEEFVKNSDPNLVSLYPIFQQSGQEIMHLDICGKKFPYSIKNSFAIKTLENIVNEYGTRALLAEKNEGVDWKALSHAVRIGEQAIELFTTGNIIFPRPNAEFLRHIKLGYYTYKYVAEVIENNFELVEITSKASSLPETVDNEWIDDFIVNIYSGVISSDF